MGFNLRSGNNIVGKNGKGVLFKKMGSSPVHQTVMGALGTTQGEDVDDPEVRAVQQELDAKHHAQLQEQLDKVKQKPTKKYTVNMADLPHGSKERAEEYDRRGWAHDSTTYGHKNWKDTKMETKKIRLPQSDKLDVDTSVPDYLDTSQFLDPEKVNKQTEKKGFSLDNYDISSYRGRVAARGELERLRKSDEIDEKTYQSHRKNLRKKRWSNFKEKLNKIVKPKKRTVKKEEEKKKKDYIIKPIEQKPDPTIITKGGGKQEGEIIGPTS